MLAHRLRHRVTFERRVRLQDPATLELGPEQWLAAVLDDGTELANVPAEVLTGPGREFQAAQGERSLTAARINLRWFPVDTVTLTSWRITWDDRLYNIRSAETDATARREWRLLCEDGVNNG